MLPGKARARTAESAAAGQTVGVHFAVWCFFGGEEIRRVYARGGEELARDRRDRAVRPEPQKSGARECVYFNNVVSVAAELEKMGREGVSPGDLPPLFLARVYASVGTNGSAARARRASAGSSAVLAFCVVCPERCGRDFERLRFPSASGGGLRSGRRKKQADRETRSAVEEGCAFGNGCPEERPENQILLELPSTLRILRCTMFLTASRAGLR